MECENCNFIISSESNFCSNCGEDLLRNDNPINHLSYAQFSKRLFPYLLDMLMIMLFYVLFFAVFGEVMVMWSTLTILISFVFTEAFSWQASFWKKIIGLKVTDQFGNKLTLSRTFTRQLGKVISSLIIIGYFFPAIHEEKVSSV